jgi:hypothetical protein
VNRCSIAKAKAKAKAKDGGRSESPSLHQLLAYPDLGEITEGRLPTLGVIDKARELFTFYFLR